jgi:hypothetical protein
MGKISRFLIVVCVFFTHTIFYSCSINPLKNINTDGLTYDGTNVYYNGELCATLSAMEVAYDNGKVVREATFVLTSSKFNDKALNIIKFVQEKRPSIEVEVELKN